MANKKNIDLIRVNMNLPISLVEKVKEYANKNGINTTAAYIVLLNQAIEHKYMLDNLPFMLELLNNDAIKEKLKKDN